MFRFGAAVSRAHHIDPIQELQGKGIRNVERDLPMHIHVVLIELVTSRRATKYDSMSS